MLEERTSDAPDPRVFPQHHTAVSSARPKLSKLTKATNMSTSRLQTLAKVSPNHPKRFSRLFQRNVNLGVAFQRCPRACPEHPQGELAERPTGSVSMSQTRSALGRKISASIMVRYVPETDLVSQSSIELSHNDRRGTHLKIL